MTFEELVAEGSAVPVEGWDFSWFDGRATEERPPWGYAHLLGERMAGAASALDVQTGGGEVLATVARRPALLVATESWPPNVALARARLRPLGAHVVAVADAPALPFADASFDLVTSRHPVVVLWEEIARVLRPGATYLSQQIGAGSNRELTDFIMGPRAREPGSRARRGPGWRQRRPGSRSSGWRPARSASSSSTSLPWCTSCARCPGRCRASAPTATADRLRRLHELITRQGVFVSTARRLLVEARRPG